MSLFSKIRHFTTKLIINWLNPEPDRSGQGTQVSKPSSDNHIQVIYGTRKVPGTIVFMNASNPDDGDDVENDHLHIIVVWGEGGIDSVSDILLNDISITDPKFNAKNGGRWAHAVNFKNGMGSYSDPGLKSTGWDAASKAHRLDGLACSYIRLEWSISDDAPFTGVPDITAIIRGKKVRNLHTNAVEYSENPAYILHDYLTHPIYGKPLSASDYSLQHLKDAALIADTLVPVYQGASETQPLFTCNLAIDTGVSILDNVELIAKSMRGLMPIINGELSLIIEQDDPVTPEGLNENHFKSTLKYSEGGKSKRYNRVIVEYIDKALNYSEQDAYWPEKSSDLEQQWLEQDNNVLLEYRFKVSSCTNYYEARQMARVIAMLSREALNFNVTATPIAMQFTVGDVVPISHNKLGWDNKPFRLLKSEMQDSGDYKLTFREHQPYIYNWLSGVVRPPIPDTSLPPPRNVLLPTGLVATALDDGHIKISWVSPYNYFDIRIYKNDTFLTRAVTAAPEYIVDKLDAGSYEIDVRARSSLGYHSDYATLAFEITNPAIPTVLIDSATYNTIAMSATVLGASLGTTFEWQFLGTENQPVNEPNTHTGYSYTYTGLQPSTQYTFKVRTKNIAGLSPWVVVLATTTESDLLEYIDSIPLTKLSEEAQTLIADINAQVDRLRPETENNLPSLIAQNIDAITGLNSKVEVLDAENPNSIPFQIDQLVDIVDVIHAENPNNLQQQLADSNSKIDDLERVTEVLDETKQNSLPALIKINNIAIEQQRLAQQNLGLSLLNVTSAYTNWRNEYERRTFNNERLIDAAVYVDPDTGTIVNRAYAYADESFNSATLLIDGVNSKITLASQQIAQSQNRISQAEAQLIVQAAQINQKVTYSEVEGQIAGALSALQPAYSWQFNTSIEGFDPDSHNALGYIVATAQISSPVISYNADENPMFRLRVRKHSGTTWKGEIHFNGGITTLHLPEPTGTGFEIVTLDATGTQDYTGTITSLEFDLGPCDIDFIEVGKRGANDLALADITARTTELEQDINAATGIMAQYATTSWVNALGYQTQSNVQTLIDSFNTQYSIAATLQEFSDQNIIVKANAAQTWIDGANATIRDQVTSILNSEDGVNQRISTAEQNIDAIAGEISQSITQVSGLELDVKGLGLNEVIAAYNQMQQDKELAEQSFSLATANQKLTAVTNDVESLATQTLELAGLYGQNAAYLTSLNQAFANERTARSSSERELRAEIIHEGTRSVAQANERLEAVVGYCVDAEGNKVDEVDALACIANGHEWVDGPLVQLINDYTTVFVNEKGYQTAANVQQYISTFDGEYSITATIQQINDEGIITAAKEAQQWINAADGTIENLITQFVNKPNGINDNIAFAYDLIQANADEITVTANAQQQLSLRMGSAEADLNRIDNLVITEQQARASMGAQLRIEFQTQDSAMLATANEFTRAVTGFCVDANGERVDQDDAVQCELDGHTWIDGPAVQRAINLSAAYVDDKGYQTQSNVNQLIDTFNSTYSITATIQQINDEGIITAAKEAQQWINAADGTITNLITQFVTQPDGINDSLAFAHEQIQANADDISSEATARQQLSVRMGEAESDLTTLDEAIVNEQQARASMGSDLRIEFQNQDLAMLATANEYTRAVTGYCVDANGERVDQDNAAQCELDGHTWIDGPAVRRAINISAAYVDEKGYQTQSNVNQLIDSFNTQYSITATLQEFDANNTLTKANNAQQFINAAEGYIAERITLFNAAEGGVDAKFSDVQQRLDAAEGAVTTSILQIQGLELGQQAQGLNDVIAAYNQFKQDQDLATLNVKASLANEKLQAQSTDLESLAQQQLELAAIFNSNNAIITSLNQAVANQYQSSVIRDQRYQATFENVTARFSDVTTALATINEASTLRDEEFASFVDDTIAEFDEITQTFASQNQAFSTLQQTLTSKIENDTEAAKNAAISTAQQYTRTAVGHCLNAQGQITSENDAVQCVADGGSWVNGPLAEFIANMQITDGESTASIKQLRQLFTTVDGKLVARGGWTVDNNGRVTGIAGYNDGEVGNLDLIADVIRQGVMVGDTFVPTIYLDNSDPLNPVQTVRGRLVLGDGHQVNSLDDIKAQDGADGATGPQGIQGPKGDDGVTTYTWLKYADNASGAGLSNSPTNKEYIGFAYNKTTATESTNPANYTWSKIKGEDGTDGVPGAKGADGQTTYTWIAYSDNASGSGMYQVPNSNTKYIGIAVNKTTATESTNPANYTWSLFKGADGQNGNDGADGQNGATGPQGPRGYTGLTGPNGSRGSIETQIATSTGAWSDATANASVPGSPVEHDRVTIYKSSDPKVQTTKRYNGSSWVSYTLRVHGSALIDDTLDAKVIRAGTKLSSPKIMGGEVVITEPSSAYLDIVGRSTPFGPSNDLISWYGPKINGVTWNATTQEPIYSGMSKSNAVSYKTNTGSFYFGGTFQAGTLSISRQATNTSGALSVLTGPFTIPGGTTSITIAASVSATGSGMGSGSCPTNLYKPNSVITIERLVGSTWQSLAGNNAAGTAHCSQEGPEAIITVSTGASTNTSLAVTTGQPLQLRAVANTVAFPYTEGGVTISGSRSVSIVVTGNN